MTVNEHIDSHILELALGELPELQRDAALAHAAGCPACAEALRALHETLTAVALDGESPPPPALRKNLLAALDGPDRQQPFPGYLSRLQQMFQLTPQTARDVMAAIAEASTWEGQGPIAFYSFTPGAALNAIDAVILRCTPGVQFARHRHVGQEQTMVLCGTLQEDSGRIWHPGEVMRMEPGSEHSFTVVPPHLGLFAVLLYDGWPMFV